MNKTTFAIPRMDCAAEERLVRMALDGRPEVRRITTDLSVREVTVLHEGNAQQIEALLAPLRLEARVIETAIASEQDQAAGVRNNPEERTITMVLVINAAMFVGEMIGAFLADSSGLLADSLDMLADAAVYSTALFGVRRGHEEQLKAARVSGVLQLLLALGAFAEVARRVVRGSEPEAPLMIAVAIAALAANVVCMWLLARHRNGGAHMQASWIFTTNDVIANLGVIAAGLLVQLLHSAVPDLLVAVIIAFLVLSGAIRILRLNGKFGWKRSTGK